MLGKNVVLAKNTLEDKDEVAIVAVVIAELVVKAVDEDEVVIVD